MAPRAGYTMFELMGLEAGQLRGILTKEFGVPAETLAGKKKMELIDLVCERQDPRQAAAPGAAASPLPPDHYLVRVEKKPLPTRKELLRTKAFEVVDFLFDDTWVDTYRLDGRFVPVVPAYGDTVFFLKHFDRDRSSEDAIRWAAANGYRPATLCETIAFAAAHPGLQRQFTIVALGSHALDGHGYIRVAVLGDVSRRNLLVIGYNGRWVSDSRFLFARK